MNKIDWSSLWKKEDWQAVWIGFVILIFGILTWLPRVPRIDKWGEIGKSFPSGWGTIGQVSLTFVVVFGMTLIGIALTGKSVRKYMPGFVFIFAVAFIATWLGKSVFAVNWGLEAVIWALALGLIIGNLWRLPDWLKAAVQTEFFIKIGLVLLGAEMLFSTIVKGGAVGMAQALLVVIAVWFFTYWVGRKLGLEETFSSVLASGISICGVSAAIAAGGAVKGQPKHISYVISLVLLGAIPMLVLMPILARAIGLSPAMAGAWIGGTVDTTGAVVAAGTLVDPITGLQVAALVNMAQNILIGFAAFFLAIWSSFSLERTPGAQRPSFLEIWFRLPKFIIGFVLASLIFSFLVEPNLGSKSANAIIAVTTGYRSLFFALAFISIGLDTRFRELLAVGRGRPLVAYLVGQGMNVVWALAVVWVLWSGTFFTAPIK